LNILELAAPGTAGDSPASASHRTFSKAAAGGTPGLAGKQAQVSEASNAKRSKQSNEPGARHFSAEALSKAVENDEATGDTAAFCPSQYSFPCRSDPSVLRLKLKLGDYEAAALRVG
jgi:hypothetical protein